MSVNGDARLSWYIDPAHPLVFDVPGTDKDNWGGYGYNNWLEVSIYAAAENFITKTTDTGRADAGRVPVFGDCVWAEAGWTYATNPVVPEDCRDDPWGNNYGVGTHFGSQRYSINRHHDGINMGFLDGHADYVAVDDLKKLYWHKNWRTTYVAEDNEG
jgi:prepilin-type processing-associated H-X9-DG protein